MLAFREGEFNAVSRCLPVITDSSPRRRRVVRFLPSSFVVVLPFFAAFFIYFLLHFFFFFYGLPTEISKSKLDLMLYQTGIKSSPFIIISLSFLFYLSSFSLGCFGYDCFN